MIGQSLQWWAAVSVIGLVSTPIVLTLCRSLPGRGYAFAKPMGLLLTGFGFWLALSLHLLPNRPGSVVWVLIVLAAISALLLRTRWQEMRDELIERRNYVIAVELLAFVAFMVAGHIRSFLPEIDGTEKPMDFMMLNAASRSRFYPPDDPWLSGFGVSYYYFGYVINAMVAKLSGLPTGIAFNLSVASTVALASTAAFGLGHEASRLLRGVSLRIGLAVGALAVVLVVVIGNLEGAVEWGRASGIVSDGMVETVDIAALDTARESSACVFPGPGHCIAYPTEQSSFWWWWRSTRISPTGNSITEFPFFSFILGDLHPHYMALPFVLAVIGLGLSFWATPGRLGLDYWKQKPAALLAAAVLLGGLGFLNTWDLPTIGFVLAGFVLARNLWAGGSLWQAAVDTVTFVGPLAVLAALVYVPFYASFSSQASGLGTVTDGATRPLHGALYWTPLMLATLVLPLTLLARDGAARSLDRLSAALMVPLALLVLWALITMVDGGGSVLGDAIRARGFNWLTTLFYCFGLAFSLMAVRSVIDAHSAAGDEEASDGPEPLLLPMLVLIGTGMLLALGAELFYVKDVFASRLNTVFKLSYQAWILLGVAGALSLFWAGRLWYEERSEAPVRLRSVWASAIGLALLGALLYPFGAVMSRTEGLTRPGRTLDGMAVAALARPEDAAAADWLRRNADDGEKIAEALGGQYSPFGRLSAWTGVPAVLGWSGHEVQWGRDRAVVEERVREIDMAFATDSLPEALDILRKYDVTYVVVGTLERQKYQGGVDKFNALRVAFNFGSTTIFRVPAAADDTAAVGR